MHGANAWFAYNFTHSFAVVAEVSSQRASDVSGSVAGVIFRFGEK